MFSPRRFVVREWHAGVFSVMRAAVLPHGAGQGYNEVVLGGTAPGKKGDEVATKSEQKITINY